MLTHRVVCLRQRPSFFIALRYILVAFFIYLPAHVWTKAQYWQVEVVSTLPHDTKAFTQGLVVVGHFLYESTGLYNHSSLRKIDLRDGKVVEQYNLPSNYFAEGLAYDHGRIVQLTWREGVAFEYALEPIRPIRTLRYQGEGWGLCTHQAAFWMSDGSAILKRRQFPTFEVDKRLVVQLQGRKMERLNALACVEDCIYANVWQKEQILCINLEGEVIAIIDASQLLTHAQKQLLDRDGVLNGIAYRAATKTFFLTGKNWPTLFEVRFVPQSKE